MTSVFDFKSVKTHYPEAPNLAHFNARDGSSLGYRFYTRTPDIFRIVYAGKNVKGLGSTGAFSNQFIEGMKLLYELEPLIKVKPYLTNQWEKRGLPAKRAS